MSASPGSTGRSGPAKTAARRFSAAKELVQPGLRKHSVALFLVTMVVFMVCAPAFESLAWGDFVLSAALSFMMLSGVLAVGASRRKLVLGLLLVIPALVIRWLGHTQSNPMPPLLFLVGALVFLTYVMSHLIEFIIKAPMVNTEVLCAGVVVYLIIGFLWTLGYTALAEIQPGAFVFTAGGDGPHTMKGVTAFYYSFITLNTVGYGDIVPVSPVARMMAVMESTTGLFYMALMVARLVSLYSSQPPKNAEKN